jgi:hypothetical protein
MILGSLAQGAPIKINQGPQFALTLTADQPSIDPGDEVRIQVFVYGSSKISNHKLAFHIPPAIIQGNASVVSFRFGSMNGGPFLPIYPPITNTMDFTFWARLNDSYFSYREGDASNRVLWSETPMHGVKGGRKMTETTAPLALIFKTPKNAPPGSHQVTVRLFYWSDFVEGMAEGSVNIQISSFGERYQNLFMTLIGIMLALAGFLPKKARRIGWPLVGLVIFALLWALML